MDITLATPALLFPAISLLLLAYTNRFLGLASVIRHLHKQYKEEPEESIRSQIKNLNKRVYLIRAMQETGVLSILFCFLSMCALYFEYRPVGEALFGISLLLMVVSLAISAYEVQISTGALRHLLGDMLEDPPRGKR